ncbi:predicted protein [Sclerotinia sclerotiorum 1980 UF-70]|uniref:Uncharacterized protein n=1 Tax=Sclerotinia sclerotiorum (strain ATCC 18683 / 1980 / Ss-1) TaxID=665079 RepID=A7E7R6_SCLS1|nr:predicted protein [Sclerotinia sclerotiorum 1980 UF-70]EDN96418.1 predicted protein [Sclerotinia sclerotiorum 1980 UF-70]
MRQGAWGKDQFSHVTQIINGLDRAKTGPRVQDNAEWWEPSNLSQ